MRSFEVVVVGLLIVIAALLLAFAFAVIAFKLCQLIEERREQASDRAQIAMRGLEQ